MDDTIVPFDLVRMFIGDQLFLFYCEIMVRTVIVYTYTFVMVRWIGGRSVAQLTTVEFLLVIALGSAVGDPMFYPEVPLLHALAAVTVIVLINKLLDVIALRSDYFEERLNGLPIILVSDGKLQLENMKTGNLGRSELFKLLRLEGFANLGKIRLAILEANGCLSCYRFDSPRSGLPIVPPEDIAGTEVEGKIQQIGTRTELSDCRTCGAVVQVDRSTVCGCRLDDRVSAYLVGEQAGDR